MDRDNRKRRKVKSFNLNGTKVHIQAPPLELTTKDRNILAEALHSEFEFNIENNKRRKAKDVINLAEKLAIPSKVLGIMKNKYFEK
jgi:hypothetical protein